MEGEAWDHWSVGLSLGLYIARDPFCLPCFAYSMMDEPSETMRKEALL